MRRFPDIIRKDVYCVTPRTTIRELVRELVERKVAGCPVLDEHGVVVGVVSFTDIAVKMVYPLKGQPLPEHVEDIMTRNVLSLPHDSNVAAAVDMFYKHQVQRLIITQNGKFLGIITPWDLMSVLQERIPEGVPGALPPSQRRSIPLFEKRPG